MTAEMKTSILDIRKRPLRRWHPHARRLIYLKRRASNLRNGYTFRYLIVAPARRRALLESVRTVQAGLQSFLSMRRIEARRKNAKAFRLRHSQSLARRRQRLSHAMVRSTIQRFGKTTNSLTPLERLTISMSRCGRTFATAFANFGPLYPLSTNSVFKNGNMPNSVVMTRAPPSRSWISAG